MLKEWLGEVVVLSVVERVPCVAPPVVSLVDCVRCSFPIYREHVFPRCVALPFIQDLLVAEDELALHSALVAERGRRHVHLLVEVEVVWFDGEVDAAVLARCVLSFHVRTILHTMLRFKGCFDRVLRVFGGFL